MKKVLLFVGIPLVLLGTVGGLAFAGIINVPGISPSNFGKKVLVSKDPAGSMLFTLTTAVTSATKVIADQTKADAAKAAAATKTVVTKPKPDLDKGDAALADVWNNVDVTHLSAMTAKWKPADLARVLMKMDGDHVSELMDTLEPARAEAVSKAIQALASKPPEPATAPVNS